MGDRKSFFERYSDDDLENLLKYCTLRKVKKDGVVLRQGQLDDQDIYLITVGRFSVAADSEGQHHELATLCNGDIFGEFSLFTGQARSANVIATEDSEVLLTDREAIDRMFEEFPKLAYSLIKHIADEASRKLTKNIEI